MKLFLTMIFLCHCMVMFAQADSTSIASVQRDSTIEKMRRLERELQNLKQYVDSQQTESKKKAADIYEANYNKMLHTSALVNELYDAVDLIEKDKKEQKKKKNDQPQQPKSSLSKKEVERLLKALQQREQQVQQKMQQNRTRSAGQQEKDW